MGQQVVGHPTLNKKIFKPSKGKRNGERRNRLRETSDNHEKIQIVFYFLKNEKAICLENSPIN
jgi:hypothetical protein